MLDEPLEVGTTEQEIFEELKIRHELEPIGSFDEYLAVVDEIVNEKVSFGEIYTDDDTQQIIDSLARRFGELGATVDPLDHEKT